MTRRHQHDSGRSAEATDTEDPDQVVTLAYARHYEAVFSQALRMARDADAAADLVQESYVRLLLEARAGRVPDNVRAWLCRVATNAAISRGRRMTTVQVFAARVPGPPPSVGPEDAYLERETSTDVDRLLTHLSADERRALVLSAHGVAGRDIADAIGKSCAGTRVLMHRARTRLRRHLELTDAA